MPRVGERDPLQEATSHAEGADQDANPRPSKRGRTRKDGADAAEPDPRTAPRSKKGANVPENRDEKHEEEGHRGESGSLRRSKRERRSADAQPWWVSGPGDSSAPGNQQVVGEAAAVAVQPNKGARRLFQDPPPEDQETVANERQKKKRGRPAEESPTELEVQPKRKGRRRTSNEGNTSKSTSQAKSPKRQRPLQPTDAAGNKRGSGPKARRSTRASDRLDVGPVDEDDMENSQAVPPAKYRHIESRTRQIPRSTISAKWTPLDEASVSAVAALVSDTYRPILLRLQGREQRHQQAQNILRAFASRVHAKLRKGIPFPPPSTRTAPAKNAKSDAPETSTSHVEEFDFERTVNSIQSLEATLNPLLHSVSLLKSEKDREEEALENDYETLRTLEANARAEIRGWRERAKRAHTLASEAGRVAEARNETGEARLEVLKSGRRPSAGIFKVGIMLNVSPPLLSRKQTLIFRRASKTRK